ncbi:hypothetical protein ACM46_14400 [Chryseobacterium angstadtii]|uniref:Uncharacterized protein n=1 Tax=Chryseobacterium angstadtii TaxID=558151 RepID=A0A0J7IB91_9FLAO|nr:hypothetical protein [Chryseobacterium angstadtii]KMQ63126.1 hypothetical protein ACM46_14400 [Chryseobacterium angstadtii]
MHYRFDGDSAVVYRATYDTSFTNSPQINFSTEKDSIKISYGYKLINHHTEDPLKVSYFTDLAEFKTDQFGNKPVKKDSLSFVEKLFNVNLFLPEYSSKCVKPGETWTTENDLHSQLYRKIKKQYQLIEFNQSETKINYSVSYYKDDENNPDKMITGIYTIDTNSGLVKGADFNVNHPTEDYQYKMIIERISKSEPGVK